jgi:hypothetical protein
VNRDLRHRTAFEASPEISHGAAVILCPNAGGDIARPPQLVNVYMKRENTEGKKTKEEEEERR